jgi:PAS domain S-box-containing protein
LFAAIDAERYGAVLPRLIVLAAAAGLGGPGGDLALALAAVAAVFWMSAPQRLRPQPAKPQADAQSRATELRLRTILDTTPSGICMIGTNGVITLANGRFAEMLGTHAQALVGRSLNDFCFAEEIGLAQDYAREIFAGATVEFEFRLRRADGEAISVMAACAPILDQAGNVAEALGAFTDLTERKQAEARQRVLTRELTHRGKNLLTVIQSIANQTLRGSPALDEARLAFTSRLRALASTYNNLTELDGSAELEHIVRTALPMHGRRASFAGPRLMLTPRAAQTMTLIVHELSDNASKHGAFTAPEGRVHLSWTVAGERLHFQWIESGGPAFGAPDAAGFGSTILIDVAAAELGAEPDLRFEPAGLRYAFDAPLKAVTEQASTLFSAST